MALVPFRRILLVKVVAFLKMTNKNNFIRSTKCNNIVEVSQIGLYGIEFTSYLEREECLKHTSNYLKQIL